MNSLWYLGKIYFPIGAPDPVEAIKFRMEQGGLGIPAEVLIAETGSG